MDSRFRGNGDIRLADDIHGVAKLKWYNQDTTVRFCKFQQSPIPGISPEFPSFHNVMSGAAKPLGKTTTCAPIYKESHGFATDTAARESPAMTAWA